MGNAMPVISYEKKGIFSSSWSMTKGENFHLPQYKERKGTEKTK